MATKKTTKGAKAKGTTKPAEAPRRGRGRPRKTTEAKREHDLRVPVTEAERVAYVRAAEYRSMSVASWIRFLANEEARRVRREIARDLADGLIVETDR